MKSYDFLLAINGMDPFSLSVTLLIIIILYLAYKFSDDGLYARIIAVAKDVDGIRIEKAKMLHPYRGVLQSFLVYYYPTKDTHIKEMNFVITFSHVTAQELLVYALNLNDEEVNKLLAGFPISETERREITLIGWEVTDEQIKGLLQGIKELSLKRNREGKSFFN